MPVTLIETTATGDGEAGSNPTSEIHYVATGSDDRADIEAAVAGAISATLGSLVYQSTRFEHMGEGVWDVIVTYGKYSPEDKSDEGDPTDPPTTPTAGTDPVTPGFQAEIGGGSQHITNSINTIGTYAKAGRVAPDMQGVIGWDGERVEGVDIDTTVFTWTETKKFPASSVTWAYLKTLANLNNCVNNGTFRTFAAGEVRFTGASVSFFDATTIQISFKFARSKNDAAITVGDLAGPIDKKGWEYLWIRYGDVADQNVLIKQPESAYVEQVYQTADFAALGIGE